MRTPDEEKIGAAKTRLFALIQRKYGDAGLDDYLKLSEADRLAWEVLKLPGMDTSLAHARPEDLTPTRGKYSLTPREVEMCRLTAQGLSNAEMSEAMGVGVRTVEWHARNICKKTKSPSMRRALAKTGKWEMIGEKEITCAS